MKDFHSDNLQIRIQEEANENIMQWLGKSDEREPSAVLTPYFTEILNDLSGKKIRVEFQNLKYINSSTVPPILFLMKKLSELKIETLITYNQNSSWQSASFKALKTISTNMEHITVEGLDI